MAWTASRCTYSDAPDSGAETATMLIIGGAFGTRPDPAFDHANPSHWYVASYLTVVIAAVGLVMLPVHVASYLKRGVLPRFAAAGFPRWSFAIAQLIVGLITTAAVREPGLGAGACCWVAGEHGRGGRCRGRAPGGAVSGTVRPAGGRFRLADRPAPAVPSET